MRLYKVIRYILGYIYVHIDKNEQQKHGGIRMESIIIKDKREMNVSVHPKLVFIKKSNGQLVLKLKSNSKKI